MNTVLKMALALLMTQTTAFSAIYKSHDSALNCEKFEVIEKVKDENGVSRLERELRAGEEIYSEEGLYGLSVQDVDINFDERAANFIMMKNVLLGFNKPLFESDIRTKINSEHQMFKETINQVNKKKRLIKSVCIGADQKIINVSFEEGKDLE